MLSMGDSVFRSYLDNKWEIWLQVLLTCPWSEQPPTEAPEIEDDEEVVRLEFVDGEVKGFYDKQEVTELEQDG